MRVCTFCYAWMLVIAAAFPFPAAKGAARRIINLDMHWQLDPMPALANRSVKPVLNSEQIKRLKMPGATARWMPVQLPNDYIVSGRIVDKAQAQHGGLAYYPAWYRRYFTLPVAERGHTIWLNFGGVYRDAVVFINGHFVGQHPSGFTGFRYDIGRWVHFGSANTLAVYVDPRWFEGWWYMGGGIYRHVRLIVTDRLHVVPWGTFVISHVASPISCNTSGDHAKAKLVIETTAANKHGASRTFILRSQIISPGGHVVAVAQDTEHLAAGEKKTFVQHVAIGNAAMWSLHHCNLYHLQTELKVGGAVADSKVTTFGIRTMRFDPDRGFFLNGKHVEIKGTANHQDFPGVGIGAPDNLWYWRIAKLKAMGSNAYRCAHNPLSSAFYRACDHLGMLVMDENRHLGDAWTQKSPPGTGFSNLSDLRVMVLQQRNDPCIMFWSMCNEEPLQGTSEGAKIFTAMQRLVHHLDPTRPVTSAMNGGYNRTGFMSVEQLLGINYHCDLYSRIHRMFPGKMIFGSEDFNCYSARGVLHTSRRTALCSQYGARLQSLKAWVSNHEPWLSWKPVVTHHYVAGNFIWTGFDYRGEPNPFGWPAVGSQTGAMDLCGFPKPCYYYWRAWWKKAPSVYIFPAWTFNKAMIGRPVLVRCYSNCHRVALFLNGKSLGAKIMPKYRYLDWKVPYAPGKLSAIGYDRGHEVASMIMRTAGAPVSLRLVDEYNHLRADGESIAPIAVEVVDAHGWIASMADNMVHFSVTGYGQLAGVANGNPASHESNIADRRRAFHGLCMVLVRAGRHPGIINIRAKASGLISAVLQIHTHPAQQRAKATN